MRCLHCGADSPAGMKFCGQCGAPLDFGLQEPGAPWIAAGTSALSGEMKQVSVLFCDIVDSTELTERIGAEAMRDLVNRFLDFSTAEVRRYDGVVPQFSGDGFMAVFGAPRTHEDHVRRALLAALAIRRGFGAEAGAAEPRQPNPLLRMGIHSGPVVFGRMGGNFATETVIGDTANVAARCSRRPSRAPFLSARRPGSWRKAMLRSKQSDP
jgi:class 3 adenylate cyclase